MLKCDPFLRDQVRDRILRTIRDTPIVAGDRLLPERKMGEFFQVNYLTVRAAMADLVAKGVVRRVPRSGTFYTGVMPDGGGDAEMRTSDPYLVAVMLYKAEHFYTEFQHHIMAVLQDDGFIPAAFCPLRRRDRTESPEAMDRFFGWNARSLVVMQEELDDNSVFYDAFLARADRYDRIIRLLSFPCPDGPPYPGHHLTSDFADAYRDAVARFKAGGHSDIAFVSGMPRNDIPRMRPRLQQAFALYSSAMFDAGLSGRIRMIAALSIDELRRDIRGALRQSSPPTAFLCLDDYRCVIVLEEARALGLPPERMPAVAGFFGTPWSRHYGFPSYHVRMDEVALRLRELMRRDHLREGTTLVPLDRVEPDDAAAVAKYDFGRDDGRCVRG